MNAVPSNLAAALVIAVSALASVVAFLFKLFVDSIKASHTAEVAVLQAAQAAQEVVMRDYLSREQSRGDRLDQAMREQTDRIVRALDTVERFYVLINAPQQQGRRDETGRT